MPASDLAALVARACHDLRNPLAAASGFARTIERVDGVSDEARPFLDHVIAATAELDQLIVALATLARAHAGPLRLEPSAQSTAELAAAVAELARERLLDQTGSVTTRVEADGVVQIDRNRGVLALADLAACAVRAGHAATVVATATGVTVEPAIESDDLRSLAAHAVLSAT